MEEVLNFKKNFLSDRSDESLLAEIRRVATEKRKESLTQEEFNKYGRVSTQIIKRRFGTWNEALAKSGLSVTKRMNITDEEIFAEIERVWSLLGHRPTREEFDKLSTISTSLIKKRFGGQYKAFDQFLKFKGNADLALAVPVSPVETVATPVSSTLTKRTHIRRYGSLINFRGMQHAPLNELGVVFLFGMLAKELGFIVEAISPEFPDCEAKKLDETRDFWAKVAIEFEYKSSNFSQHAHDPAKCDLIVCWVHNWADCPIDVLELSSIIKKTSEEK